VDLDFGGRWGLVGDLWSCRCMKSVWVERRLGVGEKMTGQIRFGSMGGGGT